MVGAVEWWVGGHALGLREVVVCGGCGEGLWDFVVGEREREVYMYSRMILTPGE